VALSLDALDGLLSGKGSEVKILGKIQKQKYEARVHLPSARQAGAIQVEEISFDAINRCVCKVKLRRP
jgi:hypothetical protein